MTCQCRTEPNIPKDKSVDVFLPVHPMGFRLADRFWKDCPVHGILDLTPPEGAVKSEEINEGNVHV